jgi:membrane complex biogenesis BtpA family protein
MFKILLAAIFLMSGSAFAEPKLSKIFKNKKPIIGVVNLPALPGQEGFVSMDDAVTHALSEMAILEEEGVDGVIFENLQGDFEATQEMLSAMTVIVSRAVQKSKTIVVGVEVLWHDPTASLAIAKAAGAKFIRTDFFADKMKADDRIIDEKPQRIIDYRTKIGAEDVILLTDIQVKYAEMIDPNKTVTQSTKDALAGKSDGVVVTGRKSGVPPEVSRVKETKAAAGMDNDVVLGSGTAVDNVAELLSIADGAIVGTSISTKTGGVLIREKVRAYMDAVKKLR